MFSKVLMSTLAVVVLCTTSVGSAGTRPIKYAGLASSQYLESTCNDKSGREPYGYSAHADWTRYHSVIVEPVVIYSGDDNQFGNMPEKEKADLAKYMHARFHEQLATRFTTVKSPASDSLRVRLTLTGVSKTPPVIGTVSRFAIVGGLYNGVQYVRGGEGSFTGSVMYAVEIYDASSDSLLLAKIVKQYPKSFNIGATIGSLTAAKSGIDTGADSLVKELRGGSAP